jgi:Tol biopolymer transport system component
LVATSAGSPRWSPDNAFIVYTDREHEPDGRIFIVPSSGGTPRLVYEPRSGDLPAGRPVWGPDGRIYFKSHDLAGRASFWVVPAAGGRPELLVRFDDLSRPSSRIDFDVDRRRFYFAIEDRQSDIYVVDVTQR